MERLTRVALAHPLALCLMVLSVSGSFAALLPRLVSETGYRAYLGADHPTVRRLDDFVEGFGGGLPIAAVWGCEGTAPCKTIFDPPALEMARDVVRQDLPPFTRLSRLCLPLMPSFRSFVATVEATLRRVSYSAELVS